MGDNKAGILIGGTLVALGVYAFRQNEGKLPVPSVLEPGQEVQANQASLFSSATKQESQKVIDLPTRHAEAEFTALINAQLIQIAAGETKEVKLKEVIDINLEVPGGAKTVYINFNPSGKNKSFPIGPGDYRAFSPSADNARYNTSIYLYAEEASTVRLFMNQDTGML